MSLTNKQFHRIILEEVSKNDIDNAIENKMSSKAFEKRIKEICSDAIENLFKELWQRHTVWKDAVQR